MTTDYISDPDVTAHTGFVLAEEAALKQYVSGLQVPNPREGGGLSEVPVWFRWPESERRMSYPFITIDLLSIAPAYDRWTSVYDVGNMPLYFEGEGENPDRWGMYYPGYSPDVTTDPDKSYSIQRYLAYNLMFQISTFARSAYHDRFLTSRLMTDVFGPRSFRIPVDADHASRRCELLQWTSSDSMETGEASKRIFRKIYTVLMETEIPASKIVEYEKIHSIHFDVYDKYTTPREPVEHPITDAHEIALDNFTVEAPVEPPSGP